jgi:glycosyltransferase involved in cell wall biosynthesis
MKLTIGMPSYNNFQQTWFTVQSLRMYQDLTDCEILVVDNYGCDTLRDWIAGNTDSSVRYVRYTEKQGTAPAKNQVFEQAGGDFVLCIDSHVLLWSDAIRQLKQWIDNNQDSADLIQGPLVFDQLNIFTDHLKDKWQTEFWGVWGDSKTELPDKPYEIPMMGMGLFGCFKDKWLGFNPSFEGFGGEEGYIHKKYHKHDCKVLSLPCLKWVHKFHDQTAPTSYSNILEQRIKNYTVGFLELEMDLQPIIEHFANFKITVSGQTISVERK